MIIRSLVTLRRILTAVLALSLFQLCAFGESAPCPGYSIAFSLFDTIAVSFWAQICASQFL